MMPPIVTATLFCCAATIVALTVADPSGAPDPSVDWKTESWNWSGPTGTATVTVHVNEEGAPGAEALQPGVVLERAMVVGATAGLIALPSALKTAIVNEPAFGEMNCARRPVLLVCVRGTAIENVAVLRALTAVDAGAAGRTEEEDPPPPPLQPASAASVATARIFCRRFSVVSSGSVDAERRHGNGDGHRRAHVRSIGYGNGGAAGTDRRHRKREPVGRRDRCDGGV
jgi:hypothetical protein